MSDLMADCVFPVGNKDTGKTHSRFNERGLYKMIKVTVFSSCLEDRRKSNLPD